MILSKKLAVSTFLIFGFLNFAGMARAFNQENTANENLFANPSATAFAKFLNEEDLQRYLASSDSAQRIHPKLLWIMDFKEKLEKLEKQENSAIDGHIEPNRQFFLPPIWEDKETNSVLSQLPLAQYLEPLFRLDGKLWGVKRIKAPDAWEVTQGENVLVAVVDTGIDLNHPALKQNLFVNQAELAGKEGVDDDKNGFIDDINGWNFAQNLSNSQDDQGHGSHVAGTIAGQLPDRDFFGVAPRAKLLAVKTHDASGASREDAVVKGILYAADAGAKVINCSWGGAPEAGEHSNILLDAIEYAGKKNALVVAAAGNDSKNNDQNPTYPASYLAENILAVASITSGDTMSGFSNFGAKSVHIAAPGSAVYSVRTGGGYVNLSGTSMAAPHASGAAALVFASLGTQATAQQVKLTLMENSQPISATKEKVISGVVDLSFLRQDK